MSEYVWPLIEDRYSVLSWAIDAASQRADLNGAPVAVMGKPAQDWYAICEQPPEEMTPDPTEAGWDIVALVDPSEDDDA